MYWHVVYALEQHNALPQKTYAFVGGHSPSTYYLHNLKIYNVDISDYSGQKVSKNTIG